MKGQKIVATEDGVDGRGELCRDQELEELLEIVEVRPGGIGRTCCSV